MYLSLCTYINMLFLENEIAQLSNTSRHSSQFTKYALIMRKTQMMGTTNQILGCLVLTFARKMFEILKPPII